MSQPGLTRGTWLAPVLLTPAILLAACSGPPEEPMLRQFFRVSQLADTQTLAGFALVRLDPKTDGAVTSFDIVSVSPERVEALQIRELSERLAEAQAAEQEFLKQKRTYQAENQAAINRVLNAENAKKPVSGRDAEVQAAWTKWLDETEAHAKKILEARRELASARPVAERSLFSGELPDLTQAEGELISKDVSLNATVRMPDGSTTEKPLVVTMQRARLKTGSGEQLGRWIITSVGPA